MSDPSETLDQKVKAVFIEAFGDRAERMDGSRLNVPARAAVMSALAARYGFKTAGRIALNMMDGNGDAAFIVALHLFPERFTPEEIDDGIMGFLTHAPNHIREACRLTNTYVWENFPYDDDDEEAGGVGQRE